MREKRIASSELLIKLGVYDISDWTDNEVVKRDVKNIYVHPGYEKKNFLNNVAILSFEKVELSTRIEPICLWNDDEDLNKIVNEKGSVCKIVRSFFI